MLPFPDLPALPPDQRSVASMALRYSDVTQDGRLSVLAVPHGTGPAIWGTLLADRPVSDAIAAQGVIPILSRQIVEGGEGPISVASPVELRGAYQLAHTVDAAGAVDRIVMSFWLDVHAPRGRTSGPPPDGAGEPLRAGRCFVEHVFTRLFAPPEQRKVQRLDFPGVPPVPPDRYEWRPPEALLALPPGAEPLEPELRPDAARIAFGLDHSDSNQHVNSQVYPGLFIDAALRRLAELGRPTALLCRRIEIAYRKPCFAGDRVRVTLRAFTLGDAHGAALALVPDGAEGRPYATAQLLLAP